MFILKTLHETETKDVPALGDKLSPSGNTREMEQNSTFYPQDAKILTSGMQNFPVKGKYFLLSRPYGPYHTIQLCLFTRKAGLDNMETNGLGHIPMHLHF